MDLNCMDITLKLVYLRELQQLSHSPHFAADDKLSERIIVVCNSIEKDLGVSKPFSVGDLVVNIQVNKEHISEIIDAAAQRAFGGNDAPKA